MITLYGAGEGFGLPEISPYVTKTEVQLKMAGLPYRKLKATPLEAPKGQVPFIEDGGRRIGDSTFIRGYLERTYGLDFDEGLDARARAEAWAVERMLENHLCWFGTQARWLIAENFEKGPARFFDDAPEALREQVLERVRAAVLAVGVTRHTEPEMLALATRSLAALQAVLGEKPYLFGDRPCGVDATAFGVLLFLLSPHFDSALRRQAEGCRPLTAYVGRMMAQFYPEFPWRASARESEFAAA
ncbi:MAG: glutathione S-transferase [Phenylobacterium sp.]|nr:glutathione S-transferase [Phenylobacterium sp.]